MGLVEGIMLFVTFGFMAGSVCFYIGYRTGFKHHEVLVEARIQRAKEELEVQGQYSVAVVEDNMGEWVN